MNEAPRPDHEDVAELLSLYALDAALPDEARAVERHVTRCAACHAELQSLLAASNALAAAPQQHAMPASVRAKIMAATDAPAATDPVGAAPRRTRRQRARFNVWVAAPMAACVALAVVVLSLSTRLASEDSDSLTPSTMVESSHVVRIDTSGELRDVRAEYADVHGVGMIVTKGLPAPPAGYTYRVWGVTPGHDMHPMGALAPHTGRDEMALQAIDAPKRGEVASIEITLERSSAGADTPAGPVVGQAEMV